MKRRLSRAPDSLWRDRSFVLLFTAQTVTVAGSWITYVVLPVLVYQLTGSALQTSLVSALEVAPYLVFGLWAGAVADRVDRRRLMVGAELASGAFVGSVPVAAALGVLTVWHVYAAAFLAGAAYVWWDAANFGAVPALVGKDRLVAAQSALWSSATFLGIVAPSVGGFLAAALGAAETLTIDAVSYALSAAALLAVPGAFSTAAAELERRSGGTMADVAEGLAFLWRERIVRTLTLLGFGVSFAGGAVSGLLVVYAVEALGLAEDDARIGLLFTAAAAGSLAASLLLPRLTEVVPAPRLTLLALPVDLVLVVAAAFAPALEVALALLLLQVERTSSSS